MPEFRYTLSHQDAGSAARRGVFTTPRGNVQTPAFMPVGTQGTVKGLTIDQVRSTGAQMVLANTYHLLLRPGPDLVRQLGGLHQMMGWEGPILTDSGGFQIFSLGELNQVNEQAATFKSHLDGATIRLTPESSIEIQEALGSDVAMVLDHVVPLPNSREVIIDALQRSVRWAGRCLAAATRQDQARFAIVQGGLDETLRQQCARELASMPFEGFAIGGLSVGEPPAEMYRITAATTPELPVDKPRYLMGVGRPIDLIESIARGIDMFDCVMPSRNGRNAMAFTSQGPIKMRNLAHAADTRPLDPECHCLACRHSRGYLRHLFVCKEMLGPILLTLHNLTYYQRVMSEARSAIENGTFSDLLSHHRRLWNQPTAATCD